MGGIQFLKMAQQPTPSEMQGQCVVDLRLGELQQTITKYFFECYAPKRWEKLTEFLDPEYIAHGPNGDTALADGALLAALTAATDGVECSVVLSCSTANAAQLTAVVVRRRLAFIRL